MVAIPEHEKLKKVADKSRMCGEFIDWLSMRGYAVVPVNRKKTRMFNLRCELAGFFEIDEQKLEAEKLAMLKELQ